VKLVFDTNIYLAGLISEGLCLDLIRFSFDPKNGHTVYISPAIYIELYKKIGSKQEVSSSNNLDWLIYHLSRFAISVHTPEKINAVKRDPDDNKLLECAVSAKADLIVTMDKDLLKLKRFRNIGIVHPKTFYFMFPRN
jgi:putative PIN family toxin of toxin-antitoxin system